MTTTIQVSEPQELLALIPYQLGFEPQESLVVVSLQGTRQRIGLIARCELSELSGPNGFQMAETLIDHCVSDSAQKLVLVFYYNHLETERSYGDQASGRQAALQAATAYATFVSAAHDRVEMESVWIVGAKSYFSWYAYTRELCAQHCGNQCTERCSNTCTFECRFHRPDGSIKLRPVADFQGTQVSAHMVLSGLTYRKNRADLAFVDRAAKPEREKAGASFRRHEQRLRNAQQRDGLMRWELETLNRWIEILDDIGMPGHITAGCVGNDCRVGDWEPFTAADRVSAAQLGKIASGLGNRRVRDAILLSLTPNGIATARSFLSSTLDLCACGPQGTPVCQQCPAPVGDSRGESMVNDALSAIISPQRGVPPITCQTQLVQSVLRSLVAHSRTDTTAPGLTLLCLLAWWQGNGASARRHNEEALKIDENYRLANLLASVLDAGLSPGWVRRNKN